METVQEMIVQYAYNKTPESYVKIIHAVQTVSKLWTVYSPVTKSHYIEYFHGRPTAFIFSEKNFCEAFRERLSSHNVSVETELCKPENRLSFFGDLYRNGVEYIALDNGQQFVVISLFDIIEKPDFSSLPKNEQPVLNPSLMVSANIFFQNFSAGTSDKNTRVNMLRALYQGRYLMPVIAAHDTPLDNLENAVLKAVYTRNGTAVTIPVIKTENGDMIIPFFTDWTELSRFDKDGQCVGNIVTFQEIEYFIGQGEKTAVNPFGFNMVIDSNAVALIKKLSNTGADKAVSTQPSQNQNYDNIQPTEPIYSDTQSTEPIYSNQTYDNAPPTEPIYSNTQEPIYSNQNYDNTQPTEPVYSDTQEPIYSNQNYDNSQPTEPVYSDTQEPVYSNQNYGNTQPTEPVYSDTQEPIYSNQNYDNTQPTEPVYSDTQEPIYSNQNYDNAQPTEPVYSDTQPDEQYDEEPITLFELRSVPNDMIQVLLRLMQQTAGVNTAYLKGMAQGERTSYLVIVDFTGDETVFNDISYEVGQYTQGVPIDFVLYDSDFGRAAAQSTYPFYQR